jgi:hypothetical protein
VAGAADQPLRDHGLPVPVDMQSAAIGVATGNLAFLGSRPEHRNRADWATNASSLRGLTVVFRSPIVLTGLDNIGLEHAPCAQQHGTCSSSLVKDAFSRTPRPHAVGKCSWLGTRLAVRRLDRLRFKLPVDGEWVEWRTNIG